MSSDLTTDPSSGTPPNARPGDTGFRADAETAADAAADHVRTLARDGTLAAAAARAAARPTVSRGVYTLAWPIVFSRMTRQIELRHGHARCAQAVQRLAPECLDRFHDDVEAVVEDTLRHADKPIRNLDAWIATRLTAATVNGHRKARGERGALQRPRPPKWLIAALGEDPWLVDLAVQILVWAGMPGTAGCQLWPLDSWSQRRIALTGDWAGSDRVVLRADVDRVLTAMKRRGTWYAAYVERPLGRKETPTVSDAFAASGDGDGPAAEPPALVLADPHEAEEALLLTLAEEALAAMRGRIDAGESADTVVADVVRTVFGPDGPVPDPGPAAAPHGGPAPGEGVAALLDDAGETRRIVAAVLGILGPDGGGRG